MPIISIPTSIAGVSVPGITSNGPLGLLYSNPFKSDILHYPRDLNSLTKGHVVQFTIYEVTPVGYEDFKQAFLNIPGAVKNSISSIYNNVSNFFNSNKGFSNIFDGVGTKIGNFFESSGLNFQPKRTNPIGTIALYMPDTLNFNYGVSYDDSISATGAIGSLAQSVVDKLIPQKSLSKLGAAITSGVEASGSLAQLGLQKAGYAINPQLQVLFQGIGFREFQMSFTFTPYSKDEAVMVEKIIKSFRQNAAPKITTEAAGMFFVPPASFGIKFLFNGDENKHLNRIQDSVITNIDVNYAPQGWSAYDDGVPVQTTLSLTFKELTLNDSAQIQNGY